MQQGNVTCFRESKNQYLVFENESDNEKTYKSQDEAMQDFFKRVGIDPNSNSDLTEGLHYNLMGDDVTIDEDKKVVIVNGKEISFKKMDEISASCKHVNAVYKPMSLLLYQDYKNGKISKWVSNKLED